MPVDFTPLLKVIELEKRKAFTDTAVIGGLDRFLKEWSRMALTQASSLEERESLNRFAVDKLCYASLGMEERRRRLEEIETFARNPHSQTVTSLSAKSVKKAGVKRFNLSSLEDEITAIPGINRAIAAKFEKLGVRTVRDLLYFFPHRHLDFTSIKSIAELSIGVEQTVIANVWDARQVELGGRKSTEVVIGDSTGNMRAVWFNNPYLVKQIKGGDRVVLSGRVACFKGLPVFESPEWELYEEGELTHTGRLVPLYPLTRGLGQRQVRRLVKETLDNCLGLVADYLPVGIKERLNLLGLKEAISEAHYPESAVACDEARRRLAFDELFLLQLGVLERKRRWHEEQKGYSLKLESAVVGRLLGALPFKLTAAQEKVLGEIMADLGREKPMHRLLQGDVGSGKTVVAIAAMLCAVADGYQAVIMAPTGILADQHFQTLKKLLSQSDEGQEDSSYLLSLQAPLDRPFRIVKLLGDMRPQEKNRVRRLIEEGEADIIIGTHTLIQEGVTFSKLGLAVIDEQHRFGVVQRLKLRQKGFNPHVLVMTATPIPRTLALTLYGDLDLSIIDELPPGRSPIKTKWLKPQERSSAYAFIRRHAKSGHQAFIICPLVEESEAIQAKAAIAEYEHLSREVFPDLRLSLIHGRMTPGEKDETMLRFSRGESDILVATPVIEVGIDIPGATVILIESAERFGLSQLHQFRGRVGRREEQGYCLLLAENPSEVGRLRLDIIEKVQDGFQLAEEDLKLRGPGEFFGTRQSGLPDLKMARLGDLSILEAARREGERLFAEDPDLSSPNNRLLAAELVRVWKGRTSESS